jgi:hypothetical protein
MDRIAKLALFALVLASLACPAAASPLQGRGGTSLAPVHPPPPPPGHVPFRMPVDPRRLQVRPDWSALEQLQTVNSDYQDALRIVRCVKQYRPRQIRRFLKTKISSWAESRAAGELLSFSGGCNSDDLDISIRILRGAAAEAMLDNLATADPDRASVISAGRAKAFDELMPDVDRARDKLSEGLQHLVECQVVLAPGLARKMIRTAPGSSDEDRMRQAIESASPACGTVNVPTVAGQLIYRIYLAQALYAWSLVGPPARNT